jgi:hypothetical protein
MHPLFSRSIAKRACLLITAFSLCALLGGLSSARLFAQAGLILSPATLPDGTVNSAYNQTISVTGGSGPYTFSVSSGALPGGLALAPTTGIISGTPNTAGPFAFEITAVDSTTPTANTGVQAYTLVIAPAPLTLAPSTLPAAVVGVVYTQPIGAAGGIPPYSFAITAGALPGGLTISTGGLITGTPSATGIFTFTITATDSSTPAAITGSRAYTLTIQASAAALQALNQNLTYGFNAANVAVTLSATGGTPPYRFAVTTQPGLGLLFGSAPNLFYTLNPGQSGQDSFIFTVTDSLNATASGVVTIVLPPATPIPTNTPLPTNTPPPTLTPTPDPRLAFQTAVPAASSGSGEFVEARLVRPNPERNVDRPRPTFEWRLATGVLEYRLQVDNGVDFLAPILDVTVRGGSYTIPERQPGLVQGIYYWRIAPVNTTSANQGVWTAPLRFTVFIGKRPFNGVYTTDQTPRFTWSPIQGVRRYVIQISTTTNFTTGTILEAEIERGSSYTVPREQQLPYGVYYWRVFPFGQPPIANVFYTLPVSPDPPPPPRVTEPGPDARVTGRQTRFSWEAVNNAAGYVLEISTNLEFSDPIRVETSELSVTLDELLPLGIYIWRVQSVNAYSVPGNWSRTRALIVERDAP